MTATEAGLDVQRTLETANRLVLDLRNIDIDRDKERSMADLIVPIQNLPVGLDEWLRVDVPSDQDFTMTWVVCRPTPVSYLFLCPAMQMGGTFKVGNAFEKTGWYAPPRRWQWMRSEVSSALTLSLIWFFEEIDRRQQYPFVVTSSRDLSSIKNPSKRKKLEEQTNTIVYLGRPPGTSSKKETNTDKAPREFGYPRRQHRRTLRSERFRNHPKYGVYKGVLVSQGWCGPKEYIHKRKVYRLWEPPEIDTTGTQ